MKNNKRAQEVNKFVKAAESAANSKYGHAQENGPHKVPIDEQDEWSSLFMAKMNELTSEAGLRIL